METKRSFVPGGSGPAAVGARSSALAVIAAVFLGVYSLGFWLVRDRGPQPEDHAQAAFAVRAGFQSGDRIFLLPSYATEAREYLGDLDLLAVEEPLQEDLEPYERVWIYSLFDAHEQQQILFEAAGHRRLARDRFDGGIVVDLYDLSGPRAQVAWTAEEALPHAKVVHEYSDGRREPCGQWRRHGTGGLGRWICPHDSSWFYVGVEYHRMGEQVRRCLWAHPPADGRLMITFSSVPLSGTLFGFAGHTLNASKRARAPVFLDVGIAEGLDQRLVFDLQDTWRPFRIPTGITGTGTVSFSVSSPDNGANHFCFRADTRRVRTEVER